MHLPTLRFSGSRRCWAQAPGKNCFRNIIVGAIIGSITTITNPGCATSYGIPKDRLSQGQVLGHYSQQGENPGTMNFILGTLTATTAVGLLANGSVQLHRGLQLRKICTNVDSCDGEPLSFKYAAAGTSFALVAPLAIASVFLFRGAVRSYHDYRQWHRHHTRFQPLSLTRHPTQRHPSFVRYSRIATPKEPSL